jgi:hypothetical protein
MLIFCDEISNSIILWLLIMVGYIGLPTLIIIFYVKFLWLGQLPYWHITYGIHVSKAGVTWPWPYFDGLLTLFNFYQVFVISSVCPLPCVFIPDSPYLVHTLVMEGTCQKLLHKRFARGRWDLDLFQHLFYTSIIYLLLRCIISVFL